VTSLSDTPHLQYYDVKTWEYRYISKLPMKNERIWSYVNETTSHLQNKLTKNIHLGVTTSTRPPFSWKYKFELSPLLNFRQQRYSFMHICRLCTTTV
jgi:hypothetical protein